MFFGLFLEFTTYKFNALWIFLSGRESQLNNTFTLTEIRQFLHNNPKCSPLLGALIFSHHQLLLMFSLWLLVPRNHLLFKLYHEGGALVPVSRHLQE